MSSLKRNVLSNVILTGSTVILPLLTFPYITKTLSTASFGQFLFIDSFTQYFILISSLGIPLYGLREIAKNKNDMEMCTKIVLELGIIQIFLAFVLATSFIISSYFIPELGVSKDLVLIGGLYIISSGFLIDWFFQGMEKFSYIMMRSLVIKVCSVISIFILVRHENDNAMYYMISTVVIVLNATLNLRYFYKNFCSMPNQKLDIKRHIKPLLVLFSINASVSVYVILDSIILGFLTDPINVSYYNIPLKIVKIYWTIIAAIGTVFIPKIAAFHRDNEKQLISELMTKSINIVLLLSLPFCFFCIIFPAEIMGTISGSKYLQAKLGLQILSCLPLVIGICNIFGTQFLMPIGKEKIILRATVIGLILSIALNFILIPNLKFLGSVIAAAVTELFVCTFIILKARKFASFRIDYFLILQILLCLIFTFIIWDILASKIDNMIIRMLSTFFGYIIFFIFSQILFKNTFINTLLNIKFRNS